MNSKVNVLVIDDNRIDAWIIERLIKQYDPSIAVHSFKDSQTALRYLSEAATTYSSNQSLNVILLDIYMPEMDGWQFLEAFHQLSAGLQSAFRVYVHSSSISPNDKKRVSEMIGVVDFLVKPLIGWDLKKILATDA